MVIEWSVGDGDNDECGGVILLFIGFWMGEVYFVVYNSGCIVVAVGGFVAGIGRCFGLYFSLFLSFLLCSFLVVGLRYPIGSLTAEAPHYNYQAQLIYQDCSSYYTIHPSD